MSSEFPKKATRAQEKAHESEVSKKDIEDQIAEGLQMADEAEALLIGQNPDGPKLKQVRDRVQKAKTNFFNRALLAYVLGVASGVASLSATKAVKDYQEHQEVVKQAKDSRLELAFSHRQLIRDVARRLNEWRSTAGNENLPWMNMMRQFVDEYMQAHSELRLPFPEPMEPDIPRIQLEFLVLQEAGLAPARL